MPLSPHRSRTPSSKRSSGPSRRRRRPANRHRCSSRDGAPEGSRRGLAHTRRAAPGHPLRRAPPVPRGSDRATTSGRALPRARSRRPRRKSLLALPGPTPEAPVRWRSTGSTGVPCRVVRAGRRQGSSAPCGIDLTLRLPRRQEAAEREQQTGRPDCCSRSAASWRRGRRSVRSIARSARTPGGRARTTRHRTQWNLIRCTGASRVRLGRARRLLGTHEYAAELPGRRARSLP